MSTFENAALLALVALLPLIVLTLTSFVKVSVVLSLLRNAIGSTDAPSGLVITGLSLVLTFFVMAPVAVDMVQAASATTPTPPAPKQPGGAQPSRGPSAPASPQDAPGRVGRATPAAGTGTNGDATPTAGTGANAGATPMAGAGRTGSTTPTADTGATASPGTTPTAGTGATASMGTTGVSTPTAGTGANAGATPTAGIGATASTGTTGGATPTAGTGANAGATPTAGTGANAGATPPAGTSVAAGAIPTAGTTPMSAAAGDRDVAAAVRALVPAQYAAQVAAAERALEPLRGFLWKHARAADRETFSALAGSLGSRVRGDEVWVLAPAFIATELREAFMIAILIFVPFLVIDLVVALSLAGIGLTTTSPQTVALPLKLVLFVAVDGWRLLLDGLLRGYV